MLKIPLTLLKINKIEKVRDFLSFHKFYILTEVKWWNRIILLPESKNIDIELHSISENSKEKAFMYQLLFVKHLKSTHKTNFQLFWRLCTKHLWIWLNSSACSKVDYSGNFKDCKRKPCKLQRPLGFSHQRMSFTDGKLGEIQHWKLSANATKIGRKSTDGKGGENSIGNSTKISQ